MEKYKHLKGIAHNWTHSFLSIENYNEHGYFIGLLYDSAKKNNASKIIINLLNSDLSPKVVATKELNHFTKNIPWSFSKYLLNQGCNSNMVQNARLEIQFQFNVSNQELPDINNTFIFTNKPKAPAQCIYAVKTFLQDNNGKEHTVTLKEWWRN